MTNEKYRNACQTLFAQAETELADGDVGQASEKAWDAAVQMVKAVAEGRGWPHRNYRAIRLAVRRLDAGYDEPTIGPLFNTAYAMHINFYEETEDPEFVADGLHQVQLLIDKLEALP